MPLLRMKSVLLLVCLCAASRAQQIPVLDARAALQSAFENQKTATASRTRYTNFRRIHETNRNEKGKVTFAWNRLFEETWINELPYERLVERDGHPLKGKDLRREQALYDDAIHGRRPLGSQERITLDNAQAVSSGADPFDALKPTYTIQSLGEEPSPNGSLQIVEAARTRSKSSNCSWRYRFWLTAAPVSIARFHADIVADNGSGTCGDAWEDETRTLIDGQPKPTFNRTHFYVRSGDEWVTIDSEITFSNYRRFTTTVTLRPATDAPTQ